MPNPKREPKHTSYIVFFPALFFMLVFEIMHLPSSISQFRPDFVSLLVIYFATNDPLRVNVGMAWISGLLLDLLSGAPLGFNALALAFQVYVIAVRFSHFNAFMIWQQMIIIGLVNFISYVGVYWLSHMLGQANYSPSFGWYALVTMFIWPVIWCIFRLLWTACNVSSASEREEKEI